MRHSDHTDMGGDREAFLTTHWSMIEGVQNRQGQEHTLVGLLLKRYWKPVYGYIRRKGYNNEEAKDLTQGFFHEVVLNRRLFERADRSKGRFRPFLLHAVNQYLLDCRRRERAQKRIPPDRLVSLDVAGMPAIPQVVQDADPDVCFHYVWKSILLDNALSRLEKAYRDSDRETHWKVFRDRVVQPTLTGSSSPSLKDLCAEHGVEDETTASNMITTAKRRFRTILRDCVQETVSREELIEEELAEILHLFPNRPHDSRNPAE